jgi:hypothetical protein
VLPSLFASLLSLFPLLSLFRIRVASEEKQRKTVTLLSTRARRKAPFPEPTGEWFTLLRTLGTDAPSSPTSFGTMVSPTDNTSAKDDDAEIILTTLGPKKLCQHVKERGVNRQMSAGSDASGDENAAAANGNAPMKVCTFKSKETWSNFTASLSHKKRDNPLQPPRRPSSASSAAPASGGRNEGTPSAINHRATPMGELMATRWDCLYS